MGLPLPPVTCYLILAVLAAPALVKSGVNPMAAHLFVFFFGALGNISPPVAPTSFAAAGIAGTDPMKTTNLTFLYCLPSFLVPYLYVYSNELLLMGSYMAILGHIHGLHRGQLYGGHLSRISVPSFELDRAAALHDWWSHTGLPPWVADLIGYVLLGILFFSSVRKGEGGIGLWH